MRLKIGKRELQKCTFNGKVTLFTPGERCPLSSAKVMDCNVFVLEVCDLGTGVIE